VYASSVKTVKAICAEAESHFDPQKSWAENLVGIEFRHRAAVALWHFVQDMDEGGFALWFERGHGGHGRRTLGPYVARMNCRVTQRIIQMIKIVFARRDMAKMIAGPVEYADLDAEWPSLREEFVAAAERFVNKCPGCDSKSIDGGHRFSCSYVRGTGQITLPVVLVGDKFVIDRGNPLASAALEAIKRQG